jgi:hypothetical protein
MKLFADETILSPSTAHRLPRSERLLKLRNWLLAKHKINAYAFFMDDDLLEELLKAGFHNDPARALDDLLRQLPDSARAQLQRPKPPRSATPPPPPAPAPHSEEDKKDDDSSPMSNRLKIGISIARQTGGRTGVRRRVRKRDFYGVLTTDQTVALASAQFQPLTTQYGSGTSLPS